MIMNIILGTVNSIYYPLKYFSEYFASKWALYFIGHFNSLIIANKNFSFLNRYLITLYSMVLLVAGADIYPTNKL